MVEFSSYQSGNGADVVFDEDSMPVLSADFTVESAENAQEAASRLFHRAWDDYDEGVDADDIDPLLEQLFYIENQGFEFSDYDDENEEQCDCWFSLHGDGDPSFVGSDFAGHIQGRTMDALMEMQDELSAEEDVLDRGFTGYGGTNKTQISQEAVDRLKQIQSEKEKNVYLIHYMEDAFGMKARQSLDHDG